MNDKWNTAEMAGECGTVLELRGDRAMLSASPNAACRSCQAKESCLMGGDGKERRLWVINTMDARPGDRVEFMISPGAVVGISLLFYFLPVVLLLAGILAGVALHGSVGLGREPAGAVFGMAGLALSFLLIKCISGLLKGRRSFDAVMVRVMERAGS